MYDLGFVPHSQAGEASRAQILEAEVPAPLAEVAPATTEDS